MRSAEVRPAAVAGTFYPGFPRTGGRGRGMLAMAGMSPPGAEGDHRAHAGYMYSGPWPPPATRACGRREPHQPRRAPRPVHRAAPPRAGAARCGRFATPLGTVPVDLDAVRQLAPAQVCVSADAHALEHSLEVQLPFLQAVLEKFAVCRSPSGSLGGGRGRGARRLWAGRRRSIVVSSDSRTTCRMTTHRP